ncbi:P-loop containing nucleoside triphosphate hydrolase protein [Coprinopsis sp. MPI-PUGE-AT-0042]|nr:P-loop containing nucleoside triphosphate hydrolase protein [Coprinopsis sp. MPI-PUGE-AT-0042]
MLTVDPEPTPGDPVGTFQNESEITGDGRKVAHDEIQSSLHQQRLKLWTLRGPKKWLKQRRPTDNINLIKGGRETDFIVVIMGPTGVGKSTFMNHVAGRTVTTVGHALASCTQEIEYYTIDNAKAAGFDLAEGRRLVLVDTPGFNHTYVDDSEILRRIAVWLASSYDVGMQLGGVIYLYDISAMRSVPLNLKTFEELCGSKAFDKIVIGTTKWSAAGDDHAALYRLAELKREYWAGLLDKGAKDLRIDNERESCKRGVNTLLAAGMIRRALKIQQELVEEEKLVPHTEAGKTLNYSMKDMLKAKKQELSETKNAEQRGKVQGEIDWLKGQIDDLDTGFFRRLRWQWS